MFIWIGGVIPAEVARQSSLADLRDRVVTRI